MLFQVFSVTVSKNADRFALRCGHAGQVVVTVKLIPKAVGFVVNVLVHRNDLLEMFIKIIRIILILPAILCIMVSLPKRCVSLRRASSSPNRGNAVATQNRIA